jgi:hypothetical protein
VTAHRSRKVGNSERFVANRTAQRGQFEPAPTPLARHRVCCDGAAEMSFGGAQSTTVHYGRGGPGRPSSARNPNTLGSRIETKASVIRPAPTSRQAVGDRGQALVPVARHGPLRPAGGSSAPIGDHREFKLAFKSTGHATSQRDSSIVDFAHFKNRSERYQSSGVGPHDDGLAQGKSCYGALSNAQYGRVEKPLMARRMPGFADLCREDNVPRPPSTLVRDRDFDLEDREDTLRNIMRFADKVKLDNVVARAGL